MTSYSRPTKSMHGGFLLVFFGILGWIYSLLAGYAAWLVWHRQASGHPLTDQDSMRFNQQFLRTGIGRLLAKRDPIQKSRDADPDDLVDN